MICTSRSGSLMLISVWHGAGHTAGCHISWGIGVLWTGRESGRLSAAPWGCSFWHLSTSVRRKAVWLIKNLTHNFREKGGNEPSLALLAKSKTGRDKFGLEERTGAFLAASAMRSSMMELELRKLYRETLRDSMIDYKMFNNKKAFVLKKQDIRLHIYFPQIFLWLLLLLLFAVRVRINSTLWMNKFYLDDK